MLIKIGIRDLSPAMVAWSRIALAAGLLAAYAASRGELRGFGGQVPALALLASVQVAAPFVLISVGEQEISSSLAGILVASTPLFTALLAIRLDHEERARGLRLVGIALGIVGVAVLLGIDVGGDGAQLLGALAVVLASLGYAARLVHGQASRGRGAADRDRGLGDGRAARSCSRPPPSPVGPARCPGPARCWRWSRSACSAPGSRS